MWRTMARPQLIEGVEDDKKRLSQLEGVGHGGFSLPQHHTECHLSHVPDRLEGTLGEEFPGLLGHAQNAVLGSLCDLSLVVD